MPKAAKPVHVDDPEDACLTAAHKIDVALILLDGIDRRIDAPEPGTDDGGYGIQLAQEHLSGVRDYLRQCAKASAKLRGIRSARGGAR